MPFLRFVWPRKAWPCFSYRTQEMELVTATCLNQHSPGGRRGLSWAKAEFCCWGFSDYLSCICKVPCHRAAALPFCVPLTGTLVTRHLPLSLDCGAAEEEAELSACSDICFILLPPPFLKSSSLRTRGGVTHDVRRMLP